MRSRQVGVIARGGDAEGLEDLELAPIEIASGDRHTRHCSPASSIPRRGRPQGPGDLERPAESRLEPCRASANDCSEYAGAWSRARSQDHRYRPLATGTRRSPADAFIAEVEAGSPHYLADLLPIRARAIRSQGATPRRRSQTYERALAIAPTVARPAGAPASVLRRCPRLPGAGDHGQATRDSRSELLGRYGEVEASRLAVDRPAPVRAPRRSQSGAARSSKRQRGISSRLAGRGLAGVPLRRLRPGCGHLYAEPAQGRRGGSATHAAEIRREGGRGADEQLRKHWRSIDQSARRYREGGEALLAKTA